MTTCYICQWADNDVPGKPGEVLRSLLRGELHAALQPFDATLLIPRLQQAAEAGRWLGEEWDWQLHPPTSPASASFIHLNCDALNRDGRGLERVFDSSPAPWVLLDAEDGRLIHDSLPKFHRLSSGQFDVVDDVPADELPAWLKQLRHDQPDAYAVLENRAGDYVQCYYDVEGRYVVEWRQYHGGDDWNRFDHWRLQDPTRNDTGDPATDRDLVSWDEVITIFSLFLGGGAFPAHLPWRNVTDKF